MICLTSISLDVISVRKVGSSGPSITNNSIVNGLSISDIPDSRRRRNVPDGPVFTVQCTTVQGDHDPVWIMGDSIVTSNTSYLTVTQLNRYVSTLEVTLNQQTAAERYTCRSAVSGVSITFLLVTGISLPFTFSNLKSFPLWVSPSTVTTFLGNSVTMTYLAAYNSAGFNNLINRLMYGLSERGKDFKLENVKGREIPVTRRKVMETPLTADRQVYLSAAVCWLRVTSSVETYRLSWVTVR